MSPENERERARLRWRVALALCTLLIPAAAAAQEGTVSGTVTVAATGAPVAGAFVLLIGGDRDTETGADGRYTLSAAAGDYVVLVVAAGFRASEKTITVTAGGTVTADFALQAARAQFGEQVVVLGSRSSRTALETPVPVDVLTETDLEDTGQTETSRIIQFLAPSFNFSTSTISDGTDIVRPSTLRGLGPDQTLVLVNGKRRHNSALVHVNGSIGRGTAGVDLNAIPSSAIERIEILRDGAAAQYGSDAIAGVINIVLKSGTGTTKLDVSAGEHFEGDGETVQASVNRGWKIANGGFVNLTAELRDRGFTNRAGPDPRRIYAPLADGSPDPREATYDRLNHRYGDAESENGYLFLNGALPTGGDGELYFFGGVADRDGESAGFNRLPGQDRTNTLLWPDGHLPLINTSVDDFSFSVGHRGTVGGGWSYDAAVVTGNNEFNFFISNSANTSLWENSPTSADAGTLKFDQTTFTLDFFGTADWGLAAPVSVALGVEYREDGYEIEAGEPASYIDGGEPNQFCRPPFPQPDPGCGPAPAGIQVFPGFQPVNEVDASRDNVAVYGDLEFPLSDRFLLAVAARYEEYSDFGDTVIGKIAGRYEASDRFAVRASASTGFRAPSLHQSNLANISTQFVDVGGELLPVEVGTFRNPSPLTTVLGVPLLEEETSTSYSVGFTARPQENLSITADAYSIDIDDRIVLSGRFSQSIPQIAPLLESIGVGAGQFFVNALDTETEGLDLVIAYTTEAGAGTVDLTGAFAWTGTDIVAIKTPPVLSGLGETLFDQIERVYLEEAQPHQAYNASARYSQGKFSGIVRANYFGKVAATESASDPARKQVFSAKTLVDLDLSWKFGNGLKVHVGGNNIFDEFPDPNIPSNSFNGIFIYPRRTAPFGFNGGYYYTRVTFEF